VSVTTICSKPAAVRFSNASPENCRGWRPRTRARRRRLLTAAAAAFSVPGGVDDVVDDHRRLAATSPIT
jgi:hypothetical protein